MSGDLFDIDVIRDFMLDRNGKVTNHELVTHFKPFLNDPQNRGVNRVKFKDYVNKLASVKLDLSGEKVLVLKKKYRDITYVPAKDRSDFKDPFPGGGRAKKPRQDKPKETGAASADVASECLNATTESHDSGSSSVNATVDVSLSQGASANKEAGMSDISALYEAAAANMETSTEQIPTNSDIQAECKEEVSEGGNSHADSQQGQDAESNQQIDDQHNEIDLSAQESMVQEESAIEDTSQLIDESLEQTYNDSEIASPIQEYSPEEERRDLQQGPAAASSGDPTASEESDVVSGEPVGVKGSDVAAGEPLSVKDRAKHLNKMTSETDIRNVTASFTQSAAEQNEGQDDDDTHSSISGEMVSLEQDEKEWMVLSSTADYHPMNKMLLKNKSLAKFKDFMSGYTALHWAAKKGKPEVVKLLCATNLVNVNAKSHGGYTPLHLAAMHGHEDVLELLINTYSANSNLRDYSGKKPKQYLKHSASSRAHQNIAFRRVGSYSDKIHRSGYFGIQVSPAMRNSWATSNNNASTDSLDLDKPSPKSRSPSRSPSWSPHIRRKGSQGAHDGDKMPPPQGLPPRRTKSKKKGSKDKENEYNGSGSRTGSESDLNLQGQLDHMNFESAI